MTYKGFTISSDNSHYKNGQHATRIEQGSFRCYHDTFTNAIEFIRSLVK